MPSEKEREIKTAKIKWYSRKECVKAHYKDRLSTPIGYYWGTLEKEIVLKHVEGYVLDAKNKFGLNAFFKGGVSHR